MTIGFQWEFCAIGSLGETTGKPPGGSNWDLHLFDETELVCVGIKRLVLIVNKHATYNDPHYQLLFVGLFGHRSAIAPIGSVCT